MKLYIESALRVKLRLIMCGLLVFVFAWGALYMAKAGDYSAWATIWVEKPIYLESSITSNPYIEASNAHANVLGELLRTRRFTLSIAQQANIPMPNPVAEDAVVSSIQQELNVEAIGAHLVQISCTASKNNYCKEIINQTIQLFVTELNADHERQAQVALQLYEEQRVQYEQQMNKSRDAYHQYLLDNPTSGTDSPALNPTLLELQRQYNADQTRYNDLITKIESIRAQSLASSEATSSFFRVMDPANDAEPYRFSMKDMLKNGLIAAVMALFTIVAITLVSTWVDPAVYTLNDVNAVVTAEDESAPELLIGIVPYNKALAAIRRRADQEEKSKSKSEGKVGAGKQSTESAKPATKATAAPPTGPLLGPVDTSAPARARQ